MPPRRRMTADEIPIDVYVRVVVSETRWRAVMRAKGVDMTGVNTGAHVGRYLRDAIGGLVDQMGVAPTPKKKR